MDNNITIKNIDFVLALACNRGDLDQIRYLKENYDVYGPTLLKLAFNYAAKNGCIEILEYCYSTTEHKLLTSKMLNDNLVLALSNKYYKVATFIIKIINLRYRFLEDKIFEAFRYACFNRDIKTVDYMLTANLIPENVEKCIINCLDTCSGYRISKMLLDRLEIDIHFANEYLFKWALDKQNKEVMDLLLSKENEQGRIVLYPEMFINACRKGDLASVKMLISMESEHNFINIHYENASQKSGISSAFEVAYTRRHYEVCEYLIGLSDTRGKLAMQNQYVYDYELEREEPRNKWNNGWNNITNNETSNVINKELDDSIKTIKLALSHFDNVTIRKNNKVLREKLIRSRIEDTVNPNLSWKKSFSGMINLQNKLD